MRKERKRSTKFVILELLREVALHGLVLGVHVVPGHKPRGQVVGQRRVDVRCGLPSGVPPKENLHLLRQEEEVDQISEICGHRLLVCHPTRTRQGPNRGTFLRHFGRWTRPPQWGPQRDPRVGCHGPWKNFLSSGRHFISQSRSDH